MDACGGGHFRAWSRAMPGKRLAHIAKPEVPQTWRPEPQIKRAYISDLNRSNIRDLQA